MKQTLSEKYFLWGVLFLVLTLVTSLGAYYLYSPVLRQFDFAMMIVSLIVLLFSMATDLAQGFTSHKWLAWGIGIAFGGRLFCTKNSVAAL